METLIKTPIDWGKNMQMSYKPCNAAAALVADFSAAIYKMALNCPAGLTVLNYVSQQ